MKKIYIKTIILPFVILGTLILKDFLITRWILELKRQINVNYQILFFVSSFYYGVLGVLLTLFYGACQKVCVLKPTKIILLSELVVLIFFVGILNLSNQFLVNIKIFFVFLNVNQFSVFVFLLIGCCIYHLVYCFKNNGNETKT
ncbi:hypothetical protein SDC9_185396 [bioreactor metagenome]|uniref:Uncharacterized protein n=1 Tax=bioreactor metagenome TaxID=1076179 RepID=A0A645HFR4_9ZZZZ